MATRRVRLGADLAHLLTEAGADLPRVFTRLSEGFGAIFGCSVVVNLRDDADPERFVMGGSWFPGEEQAELGRLLELARPVRIGEGVRGGVAASRKALFLPHVDAARFRASLVPEAHAAFDRYPVTSTIVLPLVARGELLGVLGLFGHAPSPPFTEDDLAFAQDLAARASLVVSNAMLSARLEAELRAHRKTEAWLSVCGDLVQSVDVGLLVLGAGASLEAASLRLTNAAARRALGISDDALGRTVAEVAPLLTEGPVRDALARVRAGERSAAVTEVLLPGEVGWSLTAVALPHDNVGLVLYDLTERKRFEAERSAFEARIYHAQKLESLGVLAGGIAHDFNNLLVSMMGNAGLALLTLPDDARGRPFVERIEGAAQRASDLTRQLLAYSGTGRFMVQPLELNRLVREMSELLQVSISKRAHLRLELDPQDVVIEADPAQLQQVVLNLLTNASDALGDREGQIVVATGRVMADRRYLDETFVDPDLAEGAYAVLEVSDTGVGMPPEVRQRIFEPFFTTKETGRGLGLAAVLGIVRGHRGSLRVYSEPGRGTTMKVLLPLSSATVSAQARPEPQAVGEPSAHTILVVDDEPHVRETVRAVLEFEGYGVVEAEDGDEAVRMYAADPSRFALVILDMTMPKKSGADTFSELRRLNPRVRAILSSGYNEQDVTSRFAGRGLAGFVQKPWTTRDLLGKVVEVLGRVEGSRAT